MGSINFGGIAALANEEGNIAQAAPNAYARAVGLGIEQRQAAQEQQLRSGQIQIQQQQIKDQQAMTAAMQEWDGKSINDLPGLVIKHGASANAVLGLKNSIIDQQTKLATLSKDQLEQQAAQHDQIAGALSPLIDPKQVPDEQLADNIRSTAQDLMKRGLLDPQHEQTAEQLAQLPPDQARQKLDLFRKEYMSQSQLSTEAAKQAEANQNNAKAANENAQAGLNQIKLNLAKNSKPGDFDAQIDTIFPPSAIQTGGPNRMYKGLINSALSRGDVDAAKKYIDQAAESQQSLNKEIALATNPQVQAGKIQVAKEEAKNRVMIQNGPGISLPQGATGEAALANLDPSTAAAVRLIGDGKADFSTFTRRSTPGYKQQLAAAVAAYNPNFDQNTFKVRGKEETAFTSGSQGQQLTAINTAREHMKTFKDTADALNNGNVLLANKVGNWLGTQFGSDKATNFNVARSAFAGEVGKAFAGANVGVEDRRELIDKINAASSWGQLKGYADTADKLLEGKQKSLKESYQQGMEGKPNFGGEAGGFSVKAPNGKTYTFKDQQSRDNFKKAARIQ